MSNVIAFLEGMGRDASLSGASKICLAAAIGEADVGPEAKALILAGDSQSLATMLGAGTTLCCFLAPTKENEDDEEKPQEDDDEVTLSMASPLVALVD